MRTVLYPLLASALLAQSPAPREIQGKDLPKVPGPFVDRFCHLPGYHDPAAGSGGSELQMRIRESARSGPGIPAVALPEGPLAVKDSVGSVAGWKAYRVEVPAGAKVHARIHAAHEAWFTMRTVNRMGSLEEGMLQNLIKTGNPEASYTNPKKAANTIFFVVDTTEPDVSGEDYTLTVNWTKS